MLLFIKQKYLIKPSKKGVYSMKIEYEWILSPKTRVGL